jgi:hypothetical protein
MLAQAKNIVPIAACFSPQGRTFVVGADLFRNNSHLIQAGKVMLRIATFDPLD